jgi:hypothetical protein
MAEIIRNFFFKITMFESAASPIDLLIVHTLADFQDNGRRETIIMIKWVKDDMLSL